MTSSVPSYLSPRPTSVALRPYTFPEVRDLSLDGRRVLAAHMPGQRMAWIGLLIGSGALCDPDGLDGLARATASMLDEGSERRSADEFGTAVKSLGGKWKAATDWESVQVSVEVPAVEARAAADLLAEAVYEPAFTDRDTERFLADLAAGKRKASARPGRRANLAFRSALYGDDHRLGRFVGGDASSVASITPESVRSWYATHLRRAGSLLVVGDLNCLDIEGLASTVLGDLPSTANEPFAAPTPVTDRLSRLVVKDRPGAVQSNVRIGHAAPSRHRAAELGLDVMAINIGSTILGGTISSRLNQELREIKGYTYGVYAGFDFTRPSGFFAVTSEVRTDKTSAAVMDALRIIEEFVDDGATGEEFEVARAYLAGATPIGLQTAAEVGGHLVEIVRHDLPTDYVTQEHAGMLHVSLGEVNAAIRNALHPGRLMVAVEGDVSVIGAGLAKLGL
ncbi:M16 family metallopeptidase [Amycolatopsis halotolerans]|uniref:M16 family metallopeptidase n=1 Tax=Amycolatopsis halotolerans TaxID=330083 RepID=A0ABV7QBN1_9PSEU